MSCIGKNQCPDTKEEKLLLEAHLFEDVEFRGGVKELCISYLRSDGTIMPPEDRAAVLTNAQAFAKANDIKSVRFMDGPPAQLEATCRPADNPSRRWRMARLEAMRRPGIPD